MTTDAGAMEAEASHPGRGWLPGAGSTERSASRELTPHRQVQLLWLLTLLAVVAVVVTGPLALRGAESSIGNANSRLVPTSTNLALATQDYTAGTAELLVVAQSQDAEVRSAGLTTLTNLDTTANASWKDSSRASAHLPGEARLRTTVERTTQQLSATGVALLASPIASSSGVAAFSALAAKQQQGLNQLQRLYQTRINEAVEVAHRQFGVRQRDLAIVSAVVLLLTMIAFSIVTHLTRRRYRVQVDESRRNRLESGLQRALEMARTDPDCFTLVRQAVQESAPTLRSELLVADSSRAHFHQVVTTDPDGGPGCPVMSPDECPAANRGQSQTWPTSIALDTCPYLRGRETGPCSAVCVPVSIAGKTIGVLHATAPDNEPPGPSTLADLELIARKSGERIGILRAFSRTEAQARTDPLTGLLNRRSLEAAVRDLPADARPYAVAYGDLDHFKLLNDVHGHETGDRALRLFARVLRDSVRPDDIVGRYGGEEFVVVLPDCSTTDAFTVIDRVRSRLADAQHGGTVPSFTVSFGLAPGETHLAFTEIVEQADAALLRAKSEGRDRVVLASQPDRTSEPEAGTAPPHPLHTGS
jgi:diguanylate cyclase (GGDEF)-like protein